MNVEYGAKVVDKNGKTLGTVDHIVLDTWTGEQRKFIVRRKEQDKDIFFSPEDIEVSKKAKVTLKVPAEKLE